MPIKKDARSAKKPVHTPAKGDIRSIQGNLLLAVELILMGSFFITTLLVPVYNLIIMFLR